MFLHMSAPDLLYSIFEHHLFNAIVEEETNDEFLSRVVSEYLERLSKQAIVPREHIDTIETDLKEEVLEMLRKKTYGHYNLNAFRKAHAAVPTVSGPKKSRRET